MLYIGRKDGRKGRENEVKKVQYKNGINRS